MKSRILVAVVGVPILLYVVLWGPEWLMALTLAALAGGGGLELQKCVSGRKTDPTLCSATPFSFILTDINPPCKLNLTETP